MKNKVNSVFDVLKIILAMMVVLIHGKLFINYVYPWIRIAVPLFFVMSSYFLFSKLNKEKDDVKRKEIVKTFIFRNLKLYLIWFIIFLPVTIINKKYFVDYSFINGLLNMIKDIFLSGTFSSSWYIMALVEGVLIIYFSSKKVNNKILFSISLLANIFIIMTCTYTFLFPNVDFLKFYKAVKILPFNTFLVGLLWIMVGKLFAENKNIMKNYNKKINIILIVLTGIMFYIEWYFTKVLANDYYRDCYFMLIPFTILLFYYILNIKPFYFKHSLLLRKMSTVIYVSHKSFMIIFLKFICLNNRYLVVLISVVLSIILTFIVDFLSKHIKFMKNAY